MPDLAPTVAELATRPGHEKVRVLVHRMLVDGLGVASPDIDFEQPVPEVRARIDLKAAHSNGNRSHGKALGLCPCEELSARLRATS